MIAKPIVIIYIDPRTIADNPINRVCVDTMENLNKKMPDYYWFCVPDYEAPKVEIKVFYEKDFTEVQYNELKTIIEQAIEKKQNT